MRSPRSIAIIPDGNRRYARKKLENLASAYLQGFAKVEEVVGWAAENAGIKSITFWAMSLENFRKRSKAELAIVFRILAKYLDGITKKANEKNVRIHFFGRTDLLPHGIRERIRKVEEGTAKNGHQLNLAIAYSGHDELAQAASRMAQDIAAGKIKKADEKTFTEYLYWPQDIDLVIRTGNVQRLSGFMPWQNAYAEIYFSDKLWPEFTKEEFRKALKFYSDAERRFGK